VTSSSPETSLHANGAHPAPHRAPRAAAQRPPARYEPYLDGLFTYCLSVLCDHGAAMEALGEVLSNSERQYNRSPSPEGERKAWLYALARWSCLRRLAEQRKDRPGAHATGRSAAPPAPGTPAQGAAAPGPSDRDSAARAAAEGDQAAGALAGGGPARAPGLDTDPATAERHRRELALLAWPEAAGTTPEQREVLELAVRHQLGPQGVAAVLAKETSATRQLLASAACEVERTRAALAVVETGTCPAVARLTADSQVLLSAALRRELVRHVDDCPRCRRAAERVEAAGPWPGSRPGAAQRPRAGRRAPAVLPLVGVDRTAAHAAMLRAPRTRAASPRFGRNGFPLDPKDRAARRERLRSRAVTTTVVAAVVAAPVLALWAAYRGAPETGEGHEGSSISSGDGSPSLHSGSGYDRFENAGSARDGSGLAPDGGGPGASAVSVRVVSERAGHGGGRPGGGGGAASGGLAVTAESSGGATTITLTAQGGPVTWAASVGANWLSLSSSSGTLAAGRSVTIRVLVDHAKEPAGHWSARIALHPTGAVVLVDGYGKAAGGGQGAPSAPGKPGKQGSPGKGRHGGGGEGGKKGAGQGGGHAKKGHGHAKKGHGKGHGGSGGHRGGQGGTPPTTGPGAGKPSDPGTPSSPPPTDPGTPAGGGSADPSSAPSAAPAPPPT
jgi:DNA-directed RNA polymerase specialized sigma24 family protein